MSSIYPQMRSQEDGGSSVRSRFVETPRLRCHLLERGSRSGTPVVFVHGNFSSSVYFEEFLRAMPDEYYCLAVDLRGYGQSQDLLIDATRGARDWSDDLNSLLDELEIERAHFVGWSAGAAAIMQFALDYTCVAMSLTLIAPVSPFGFGGSKSATGEPCYSDFAGSGGGIVDREFVRRIATGDETTASPLSPLSVIRSSFVAPPFSLRDEGRLLAGSMAQKIGEQRYPGDSKISLNWPYTSPGDWGPLNAISAKYLNLMAMVDLDYKPPILWVRGDRDSIVSDRSLADPAVLGQMQLIPDWPGADCSPAQPMVAQTRAMLDTYQANGGIYREVVLPDVGHTPFLERPEEVYRHFLYFLGVQR